MGVILSATALDTIVIGLVFVFVLVAALAWTLYGLGKFLLWLDTVDAPPPSGCGVSFVHGEITQEAEAYSDQEIESGEAAPEREGQAREEDSGQQTSRNEAEQEPQDSEARDVRSERSQVELLNEQRRLSIIDEALENNVRPPKWFCTKWPDFAECQPSARTE